MAAPESAQMFTTGHRQRSAPAQVIAAATTPTSGHVHRKHERAGNSVFLREARTGSRGVALARGTTSVTSHRGRR
jgi:hypothetical protein